jgi:5-methylcytosine-specific restriction endonuclease McrA
MELRAKNSCRGIGLRSWTPQDQVNLEVAAACGVPLNRLAALWKRSESHLKAKLSRACREARKQSCRYWRLNNREHYLKYAKLYSSRWRKANPERYKKAYKAYYATNKKRILRVNAQWRRANRERKKAIDRAWYALNRERCLAVQKKYYQNNKQKLAEASKLWRQRNIDKVRATARRHAARRRARQKPLIPAPSSCMTILGAVWSGRCAYCGKHGALTADHVLPVAHGGVDELSNLVPACGTCNSSKQHKPVESWYRAQPFFTEARWRKIQRRCPAAVAGQLPLALPV